MGVCSPVVAKKETVSIVHESIVDREEDVIVKAIGVPFAKASLAHEFRSSLKEPILATGKNVIETLQAPKFRCMS